MTLFEGDVHVWYSSLDLPALSLRQLEATLDLGERQRARLICFELDRARFVVSRGLLRRILGHYLGVDPSELRFCYDSRGKPALTQSFGVDRIQFNVAHSAGFVIYAVTLGRKIGVDLEPIVPIVELEQIADRFFSDREKASLHALVGEEQREAFFKIWTAKEAYLKACGEGLAHPLNQIEAQLNPDESLCSLRINGDVRGDSHWSLEYLRPTSDFIAALVLEECNYRLACYRYPELQAHAQR